MPGLSIRVCRHMTCNNIASRCIPFICRFKLMFLSTPCTSSPLGLRVGSGVLGCGRCLRARRGFLALFSLLLTASNLVVYFDFGFNAVVSVVDLRFVKNRVGSCNCLEGIWMLVGFYRGKAGSVSRGECNSSASSSTEIQVLRRYSALLGPIESD